MKENITILKKVLLGAVGMSMALTACTDLNTTEKDSVVINTSGGKFEGDPASLLSSVYADLGALTDQANVYALYEQTTDEMLPPTRGVDWGDNGVWRTLHQHTWDPTHQQILDSWNQLNQRAFKCNQILASSPSDAQAAEAKFMRAFFMFFVMDLYGQVPFRNVDEGVDVNPKVMTRSEAFDFIVKDLEEALPNLSVRGPSADNGKASKASANFLLAKLYLNKAVYKSAVPEGPYTFDKADMDKVIGYVDAITADGYSFEPQYFDNFRTVASKELIFTSPSGTPQNRIYMTLHYDQNPSGWNGFTTVADFYAKFEDNDSRKHAESIAALGKNYYGIKRGFLIGQQYKDDGTPLVDSRTQKPLVFTEDVPLTGAATNKGIRVIKYHPADQGKYIFFRYADAYLMKAEAIMRGGTASQTALEMVNALRAVRGASALGSLNESAMLDERGRELYWEGVRRTDQIRFGTFTSTWAEKTVTEPFRVLFPIPQQALDSNPNLQPNPGY
ncbi:RagB/SusD family nutrient uptake outer membrane protein [Ohtaekwangia sp.]|uniref:RagB/SusD family nutrient uptake outer membrane protein n=1 Tax=Ohtaekwangia sp. TaxID=2066019 RepID=UPI002F95C4E2